MSMFMLRTCTPNILGRVTLHCLFDRHYIHVSYRQARGGGPGRVTHWEQQLGSGTTAATTESISSAPVSAL